MSTLHTTPTTHRLLRLALRADAAVSLAAGLAMAGLHAPLSAWLGLPATLLLPAGLVLLPYAAALWWLASRRQPPRGAVWAVIAANGAWAVDCAWVLWGGAFQPTGLGQAFLGMQALSVLAFADLQFFGLRRSVAPAAGLVPQRG